eukprot:scaffold3083_cov184-Skeletonema_dohrnii-CCMP3373.AAC.1
MRSDYCVVLIVGTVENVELSLAICNFSCYEVRWTGTILPPPIPTIARKPSNPAHPYLPQEPPAQICCCYPSWKTSPQC